MLLNFKSVSSNCGKGVSDTFKQVLGGRRGAYKHHSPAYLARSENLRLNVTSSESSSVTLDLMLGPITLCCFVS